MLVRTVEQEVIANPTALTADLKKLVQTRFPLAEPWFFRRANRLVLSRGKSRHDIFYMCATAIGHHPGPCGVFDGKIIWVERVYHDTWGESNGRIFDKVDSR
ncbi:predicted protein [Histoplasma capsulatum var. duboisii H88]|uniref:Predicted protein n=1 Tax=Ajellomyces capsulatus (strain H88) TaxID=544711 RepID=F0UMD7_AJEC8|nr:predicted protein [Histoplasma capsulatum var. duboisii H88]